MPVKYINSENQKPILARIQNEKGYEQYKNLTKIRTSFCVFRLNYLELKKISISKDYFGEIFSKTDLHRWKLQNTLIKNQFNTLASALAFVEHINLLTKGNAKLSKIIPKDEEILCFYRAIRNYLVHITTFDLVTKSKYDPENDKSDTRHIFDTANLKAYLENTINSPKDKNSKSFHSNRKALHYLKSLPEEVNLLNLNEDLNNYMNSVRHSIVIEYIREYHQDFLRFHRLALEIKTKLKIDYPMNGIQIRHLRILLNMANKV